MLKFNFYSLDSEQLILAGLISYNNSWNCIYTLLSIESFYFKNHKILFSIILEFLNFNINFDIFSIYNKIKNSDNSFDSLNYLNYLIQKLPNPSHLFFYASIIHNNLILRKIFYLINNLIENMFKSDNLDVSFLLDYFESSVFSINKIYIREKNSLNWMLELYDNYINNKIINNFCFNTGFFELDNLLSGINKGDFLIIAGRPSMGKTAFSLNISNYISTNYNTPIIIFSMEMSINQIFIRILSLILDKEQKIIIDNIKNNELIFDFGIYDKIKSLKIFIDDTSNISILQIYSKCKFVIKEYGDLCMIVIDYLQLICSSSFNQNRVFEVSEISRSLKCLAKELNIIVFAISQLNRNLESRNNKRPTLSDLRESGSIEQDADIVLFVYRDEIYNTDEDNFNNKNLVEIIVAKHRNGSIGKIFLKFFEEKSKFINF